MCVHILQCVTLLVNFFFAGEENCCDRKVTQNALQRHSHTFFLATVPVQLVSSPEAHDEASKLMLGAFIRTVVWSKKITMGNSRYRGKGFEKDKDKWSLLLLLLHARLALSANTETDLPARRYRICRLAS